jgi:dolichol-phosphate mannosyltransferase
MITFSTTKRDHLTDLEAQRIQIVPDVAVIVPVLNEADNVVPFVSELESCLNGNSWEIIFVDDDSQDGTPLVIENVAKVRPNIRVIRRFGRQGLSSACLEGMCSSMAPYLVVMDGDLQHDPKILPQMLHALKSGAFNLAIGSRYIPGGGVGSWNATRQSYNRLATRISQILMRGRKVADPMSGFFMIERQLFLQTVDKVSGKGFKILLDIFVSTAGEVRWIEVPYTFRNRHAGQSKLDFSIMMEFAVLLLDKTIGKIIPYRFVLFVCMGCGGAVLHLSVLGILLLGVRLGFTISQTVASVLAMCLNFSLNNAFTHRDRKLSGIRFSNGLLKFIGICSVGAFANLQVAGYLYHAHVPWWLSGLLGALIGAVWNYAVSYTLVWKRR